MTFSRSERREHDKGTSQPLFLSLFLLLLAFFIMLNAISTVEEGRSNEVMESVKRAFPSALRDDIEDNLLDAVPGEVIGQSTKAAIGAVFKAVLPAVTIKEEADGNPIYVSIPARRVYAPAAGGLTPVVQELATRLAPILNNPPAGSVLDFEILYGLDDGITDAGRRELMFRASETVRAFIDAEVDPAVLAAGIEDYEPEMVRMVFRTRPAGASGPDLSGARR